MLMDPAKEASQVIIGLIGTRFSGLDGVTLESKKVAAVLQQMGHGVAWLGGLIEPGLEPCVVVPGAFFDTPSNRAINDRAFGHSTPDPDLGARIRGEAAALERSLTGFIADFDVDVLMPQNALAIPMQLPLGVAIADVAGTTGIPTIAHHHDFWWERSRFRPNVVGEILETVFPPVADSISHLVINHIARDELAVRRRVSSRVLPNVMDFEHPPEPGDGVRFRELAGLGSADKVILQPTRMVPRKGIEATIELAARLDDPSIRVVVTHPEADEGTEYGVMIAELACRRDVDFRLVPVGTSPDPTLGDAYAAADLVSYPSLIEGFGNALLEAFYYRRPVVVNRYEAFRRDIAPHGVRVVEMDGAVSDDVVAAAGRWLADPADWSEAVAINYDIGRRHFSYAVARRVLGEALSDRGFG